MQKMTQKDYFNAIIEVVGEAGRDDLVDFCQSRIDALNRKAENKKPSKTQEANEEVKVEIARVLGDADAPMTVTEIMAESEVLSALSNQKISSLLRQMVLAGTVVKSTDKKRSLFAVA